MRDRIVSAGVGRTVFGRAVPFFVFSLCFSAAAWGLKTTNEQKLVPAGLTDGEVGWSLDLDGGLAVVGAPVDSTLGNDVGAVYLYAVGSGGFSPLTTLTASDGVDRDEFGIDVSIDGDTIAVGAYHRWPVVGEPGRAYMFEHDGANWIEKAKLVAPDGVAKDAFGWAIDVSGDYVAVGAPRAWSGGPSGSGGVYIFHRVDGEWEFDTKLSRAGDGSFGWSLALDGDTLAVGSSNYPNERVSVYVRDGGGTWSLQTTLDPADSSFNEFGTSVALDGNDLVVGAWNDQDSGNYGAAYFYNRQGTTWSMVKKVGSPGGERAEVFGEAVAIDGDLAVVTDGSFDIDAEEMLDIGAAYLYKRAGSGWSLTARMIPGDAEPWNNYFGSAAAIQGSRILIGSAYAWDEATESYPGAAYSYDVSRGSKLAIKNSSPDNEFNNRIVFSGKGLMADVPTPGSADDPTCAGGGSASIEIASATSGEIVAQALPCANWEQTSKGYLYRDPELDDGPCKVVSFAPGKTSKALCSGQGPSVLDFDLESGVEQVPIGVKITLGTPSYCVTFGGKIKADGTDGEQFKASNAGALEPCD